MTQVRLDDLRAVCEALGDPPPTVEWDAHPEVIELADDVGVPVNTLVQALVAITYPDARTDDQAHLIVVALVLGGARCLENDVRQAQELVSPADATVIAVNDAGFWWPRRLDHWVSMHAEEFPERERIRADRGYPGGYTRWTRPYPAGMKDREANVDELMGGWSGSSGLLAVGVAVERLGCNRVILCGMPMDDRPHFNRKGRWQAAHRHWLGWLEYEQHMQGKVRSFSGKTRELLGSPTRDWVLDRDPTPYVA